MESMSPSSKTLPCSKFKSLSDRKVRSISFCSTESSDDGFLELGDLDKSVSRERKPRHWCRRDGDQTILAIAVYGRK